MWGGVGLDLWGIFGERFVRHRRWSSYYGGIVIAVGGRAIAVGFSINSQVFTRRDLLRGLRSSQD